MAQQILDSCKMICVEKSELCKKPTRLERERHCDAAAVGQTAQECRDFLRIREDSGTDDCREESSGSDYSLGGTVALISRPS